MMPLQRIEQHEPVSLRAWKDGQQKQIEFCDDGRDITTVNGASVIYTVKVGDNAGFNSLWFRPGGSLHIAVSEFLPLKGKTLMIQKEIQKGKDVTKGTRYHAKQLKQEKM